MMIVAELRKLLQVQKKPFVTFTNFIMILKYYENI